MTLISFSKKIVLYIVIFLIALWMFVLGVIVGRGCSPVNFDTEPFQKRFIEIFENYNKKKTTIENKLNDILNEPANENIKTETKKKKSKSNHIKK